MTVNKCSNEWLNSAKKDIQDNENEISALKKEITSLVSTALRLNSELSGLQNKTDIKDIRDTAATLNCRITSLRGDVSSLYKRADKLYNDTLRINKEQLDNIRKYLINRIFLNSDLCFNDVIRGTIQACDNCNREDCDDYGNCHCINCENGADDLIAIIASLYNLLHREITGETYEYFFHFIGKSTGGDLDETYFDPLINNKSSDKQPTNIHSLSELDQDPATSALDTLKEN